jgi:2-polyprenyl-3-methyl-5-hydroxy-6-metoxy-1,4-benzoquinol methylase
LQYDPIKNTLARFVGRNTILRRVFYKVLGMMFLREWYVKKRIKAPPLSPPLRGGGARILDAGCGFGQYSYFMARRFGDAKILAIDVKEDQIEDCRYLFGKAGLRNCKFKVEDLTQMNYENEFDFILSVDVMEHIKEDEEVMRRFWTALKSGGRVLINTPSNLGGSDAEGNSRRGPEESFIGEHVRTGYSKEEIHNKMEKAGFVIESFEYTYGQWGKRYWKLAIKYPMLMLNMSQIFFLLLPFYYLVTIWSAWLFMWLDVMEEDKKEGTGILVVGRKE